jgi:hypothetical protein
MKNINALFLNLSYVSFSLHPFILSLFLENGEFFYIPGEVSGVIAPFASPLILE